MKHLFLNRPAGLLALGLLSLLAAFLPLGGIEAAPTAHGSMTLSINSAAYSTNSLSTTLTVAWSGSGGDPTQARFANDLTPEGNCSDLGGGVFGSWTTLTEIGVTNTATFPHTIVTDAAMTPNSGLRRVCSESAHGALGVPSGTQSNNDTIFFRVDNPPLTAACGLDMVLVLDSSGSIDATELATLKSAMTSFVAAFLPETPTQIAVIDFDDAATVTQGFTNNETLLNTAINAVATGGFTNWDDAIRDARLLFPNRPLNPDLIVFASDGDPTARGGHTDLGHAAGVTTNISEINAMAWASAEANMARTAGVRILSMGIGTGVDTNNMVVVSGPTTHPTAPIDENVDIVLSDFSTLAADLSMLALNLCGGTITVSKIIDADGNPATTGDQSPGPNWTFDCTTTSVDPPGPLGEDKCTPTSGDTDLSGMINFPVSLGDDSTATANIVEPGEAGYTFVSASCTKPDGPDAGSDPDPVGTPGSSVVNGIILGPLDIITCVFYNTSPTTADVKITSQVSSGPPSANANSSFTINVKKVLHNNGPATPAPVIITPIVSAPPDCTVTPAPGNPSVATLFLSIAKTVDENFNVTCTQPSNHLFSISNCIKLDSSSGYTDPNPSNDCWPAQQVSVNIFATSDVKVTGVAVTPPVSANAGAPFGVGASANLHNNGPTGPTNVDTTLTLNLPPGCTTSSPNPQIVQNVLVGISVTSSPGVSWTVTCTNPSNHSFTATASAVVDQLHTTDPTSGNNSATSGPGVTSILATTDVKVTAATVSLPPSVTAGVPFGVTGGATLHNNGPISGVNVDLILTLLLAPGCTTSSPNPATIQNVTLPTSTPITPSALWTVTCSNPSNHQFRVTASAVIDQLHVSDSNGGNNSMTSNTGTTAVNATTDVKVTAATVSLPPSVTAGVPFGVVGGATLHNNGPVSPVSVDTTFTLLPGAGCTTSSPNPVTVQNTSLPGSTATPLGVGWTVTCPNPSNHQFRVIASAAIDQLHVVDSNGSNNSMTSNTGTTAVFATADVKVTAATASSPASASAGLPFTVSGNATIHNNGPVSPVNAVTTLALLLPPDCTTSDPNPVDQSTSFPASTPTGVGASWTVTCTDPSDHQFQVVARVTINQLHVTESNGTNNQMTSNTATTAVTADADVKVSSAAAFAPGSGTVGAPFTVSGTATLHNNGPVSPVNADTTFTLLLPPDCTTSDPNPVVAQDTSLVSSVPTLAGASWTVTCTIESDHLFIVRAEAAVDQLHVIDPAPLNNGSFGTSNTSVTSLADVKVVSVPTSSPGTASTGTPFNVSGGAILHNNGPDGPANVDTTFTLTLPGDCTTASPNPVTIQDTSLPTSVATPVGNVIWSVTCSAPSDHTFTVGASTALDQLHTADPDTLNNSGSGGSVTAVTASADLKATGALTTSPASVLSATPFTVSTSATVHNNGPHGPVNADTTITLTLPADCTTASPNPLVIQDTSLAVSAATPVGASWSVTCSAGSNHDFTATTSAAVDQLHVVDPTPGNNSSSDGSTTAVNAASDVKVTLVTVTAPATAPAYAPFTVSAVAKLHNNGPTGPTNVDTTITLTVPGDCTVLGPNPASVPNTSLPVSTLVTLSSVSWSVTCTSPSAHALSVLASAVIDQLHVADPNGGNNANTGGGTTNIIPAKITVCKDVIPDDASVWNFQVAGPSPATLLGLVDGQCVEAGSNMIPGSYTVSETFQNGYAASVDCGANGFQNSTSITFTLDPGEQVTCQYVNAFHPGENPVGGIAGLIDPDSAPQSVGDDRSMGSISLWLAIIAAGISVGMATVRVVWARRSE